MLIQFEKYNILLHSICALNIKIEDVMKHKNKIKVNIKDILCMYKLMNNKANILYFLNSIQEELENNILLNEKEIVKYIESLSNMANFINKYNVKIFSLTKDVIDNINLHEYLYYLPNINTHQFESVIVSDFISFMNLIDFIEDCETILCLKQKLENLTKN